MTHPHLRAFPLCTCGSLKRYGELACALCLSRIKHYADFLAQCDGLERRLVQVHLLSAAEHAARVARRETRRTLVVVEAIHDTVHRFVAHKAGNVGLIAAMWGFCVLGILYTMLPRR